MRTINFCGRSYNPVATDSFCFDDIVCINNKTGWVDFIGAEIIALIDEKEETIKIPISKIKNVYILCEFNIRSVGLDIPLIRPFNWITAQKELGS